jgi:hypothetical protein
MVGRAGLFDDMALGPSLRMGWPLPCFTFSQRISMGLIRKGDHQRRHHRRARTEVRYLNRRKKASWSVWVRSDR